jgi:hypothetical protein
MANDLEDHGALDAQLDRQLRRAMAALDRGVPPGTFDGLADRVLARLEDASLGELPALHLQGAADAGDAGGDGDTGGDGDAERVPALPSPPEQPEQPEHPEHRAPPALPMLDDDSGLKDIRTLASETKARLSSRRSAQELGVEEVPAASSSSWKSVALPEPARVVALPAAPSPSEIMAATRVLRGGDERAAQAAGQGSPAASGAARTASVAAHGAASPAASGAARAAGGRRVRPVVAGLGIAIAAAAGAVIVVSMQGPRSGDGRNGVVSERDARAPSTPSGNAMTSSRPVPAIAPAPPPPPSTEPAPAINDPAGGGADRYDTDGWQAQLSAGTMGQHPPADAPVAIAGADKSLTKRRREPTVVSGKSAKPGPIANGSRFTDDEPISKLGKKAKGKALVDPFDDDAPASGGGPGAGKPGHAATGKPDLPSQGVTGGRAGTANGTAPGPAGATAGSGAGSAGDPAFDALLQEAGVHEPPRKPKLDRTSLSGDDIKRGMTAVEPRARACFAGTAGLASVRLAVAPSGQVQKVTVTGPFAGTAVGACVARAVQAAVFPAWDGAPQSFGYSYLLSE